MRERFFRKVVYFRKTILIIFAALAVICAFLKPMVGVDYDNTDYLPEDSPSTIAMNLMHSEFEGNVPQTDVMLRDVTVAQALEYKAKIEKVKGVTSVTWLDDVTDIDEPLETADSETVETYYKDGNALLYVAMNTEDRLTACDEIREIIGDENCMTGGDVSIAVATESTVNEILLITLLAVAFVTLILLVTTDSWLEPLLIMVGLGVGVIINAGSNILFGQISFVTNAAGNVLQLAISLDFSVFLLHRWHECRGLYGSAEEDMIQALSKAGTAVCSSALTVMMGFLALVAMRFKIGPDLGYALAKGIFISLITVFTFTPALLVTFVKKTEKLNHRPFLPSFDNLGKAVCRIMVPLSLAFLLLPIPAFYCSLSNDYYYGTSYIFEEGTQFGDDMAAIDEVFGENDKYVLMVPKGDSAAEKALSGELRQLPQVKGVTSFVDNAGEMIPDEYLDSDTLSKLKSNDYSRMILDVVVPYEGEETFALVEQIRDISAKYYGDAYGLAGEGVCTYDLMDTVNTDMVKIDILAIAAVFLVLTFAMRSVSLPVILVTVIETSIWANLGTPYLRGTTIFYLAYLMISAIQLGASVDYAILFTDRYKEFRRVTNKRASIQKAVSASFVPVMTSGLTLTVCGFLIGAITSHQILAEIGFLLGRGTLISLAAVIFILPGFLYMLDPLISKTTLHAGFCKDEENAKDLRRERKERFQKRKAEFRAGAEARHDNM